MVGKSMKRDVSTLAPMFQGMIFRSREVPRMSYSTVAPTARAAPPFFYLAGRC